MYATNAPTKNVQLYKHKEVIDVSDPLDGRCNSTVAVAVAVDTVVVVVAAAADGGCDAVAAAAALSSYCCYYCTSFLLCFLFLPISSSSSRVRCSPSRLVKTRR